jgi:hypothetical protein
VAKDRQAVVIRQRVKINPRFAYCNRRVGRWRQLGKIAPLRLLVAGRYVAWMTPLPPPTPAPIELVNTRTGQHNVLSLGGIPFGQVGSPVPAFLLSPNGVVAAIVVREANGIGAVPGTSLQVLTLHSQDENLDGASPPSEIANLRLYDCTAGCVAKTTILAWTNGGQQRYAQITP